MRESLRFLSPLSLLLLSPGALAEDLAEPPPAETTTVAAPEDSEKPRAPSDPAPSQEAHTPTDSASPTRLPAAEPASPLASKTESALRPMLSEVASAERLRRYGEGALGLAASGALFGIGFAAEAPDMTWSHALWVASGIAALGSVATIFLPSEMETLEHRGKALSDDALEKRWEELAHKAKVERRVGAVLGGLVGAASITFGILAFEGEIGSLTDDQRRIVGSVLVSGGALGITKGAMEWFVPSPVETGFALAKTRPQLSFGGAPSPTGFHLSLAGAF